MRVDERPDQIELLFYAERPEMTDPKMHGRAEPALDRSAEENRIEPIRVAGDMEKQESRIVADVGRP
jgi:hypothetical protein